MGSEFCTYQHPLNQIAGASITIISQVGAQVSMDIWNTLIASHWYWRNWNFYTPVLQEALRIWNYKQAVSFNFPWHDDGQNEISFQGSLELLEAVLEESQELFWDNSVIWWHSYWAVVSSFLAWSLWKDTWGLKNLILSSLPYSLNNQMLTGLAKNTIGKRTHQGMLDWPPVKRMNSRKWVNWKLIFGDLTISDWPHYVEEFWSMPSMSDCPPVSTPTTIIRARVDFILCIYSRIKKWEIQYFWKKQEIEWFKNLDTKFQNLAHEIIPWWGHGLKVPTTIKRGPHEWPKQVKALLKIITNTWENII